jgi:hypothetical protein
MTGAHGHRVATGCADCRRTYVRRSMDLIDVRFATEFAATYPRGERRKTRRPPDSGGKRVYTWRQ